MHLQDEVEIAALTLDNVIQHFVLIFARLPVFLKKRNMLFEYKKNLQDTQKIMVHLYFCLPPTL